MKAKDEEYAVSELYAWFKKNQEYFISTNMDLNFKDTGRNSASVNLECETYIMQLCAWDHASCLDIQTMDCKTEEISFPHTGDCNSKEEFKEILNDFLIWHKSTFDNT